ncbi:hypothetical protein BDU57DRAFT_533896 [Ampelomyces quisqualis]|uniref:Uncharacterized protein n=1 Tax=Ampelomyces quisqualis TaxID=50730 RepID=A0A6A5QWD2_AMPQU|nr:hypothetical protein BDU57DRAFT_533896 [Ampelomyces quisqualis]
MGRQAYLAKLAFGRSAFEPTHDVALSDEFIQLESSQADLPQRYQDFNGNNYIQLFDERGNPMNPRSREYGKKLRNAQNDVLAAVGVVKRRRSPSAGLLGSYEYRLDELDAEDSVGGILSSTFTTYQNICTWWIGVVRDRILTFRYHEAMPFAQIVALEHAVSGTSIVYTGLLPTVYTTVCSQSVLYLISTYQPLLRLLHLTHAGGRRRKLYRLSKDSFQLGLLLAMGVWLYPFSYHADLQRLGLIPAHPYLPPWSSLSLFSIISPLRPFSMYYDASASLADCAKAVIASPAVMACAEHLFGRWVYATISEAVDASVTCPDNPDIVSPEAGNKHGLLTTLGFGRPSPPLIRKAVARLMLALGWSATTKPVESRNISQVAFGHVQSLSLVEGQTIDVGGTAVTNVTPLELNVARPPNQHDTEDSEANMSTVQVEMVHDLERPVTPGSPLASAPQYDDDDPRIRITNREGIVEMEVRLPPHILSTHTEVHDALASAQGHQDEGLTRRSRRNHRVSKLSLALSDKISGIVKTQLVGLIVLPVRLVVLRMVASHYLCSVGGNTSLSRVVVRLPRCGDSSWRWIGVQVSRVALCSAVQMAVDVGLWGVQYMLSVSIGKAFFGWGTL